MKRSIAVVSVGSAATLLIQLAALSVLSRLLRPEDFGLIAMLTVFLTLAHLVRDFGLTTATLQAAELSDKQSTGVFWFNMGTGTLVCGVVAGLTPIIAHFYREPRLAELLPPLSLIVLLGAAAMPFQVQLIRRRLFGRLVFSDVLSQGLGLAAGVGGALWGLSYWSLVLQALTVAVVSLIAKILLCPWKPGKPSRGSDLQAILRNGTHFAGAQFLSFAQANVDILLIGSRFGATSSGYYNRSYQLANVPASRILDPITQVVLSRVREGSTSVSDSATVIRTAQIALGLLVLWPLAWLIATTETLVPALLGPGWGPVEPILRLLAIAGVFSTVGHATFWLFIINDASRDLLRYNLVSKPLSILMMVVGLNWGVVGVAAGLAVGVACSWPLALFWIRRSRSISISQVGRTGGLLLVATAVATLGTAAIQQLLIIESRLNSLLLSGALAGLFMFAVASLDVSFREAMKSVRPRPRLERN